MWTTDLLVFVIMPGIVGGAINAWLVHTRFYLPRFEQDDDGKWSFDPGCFGNIALGAVASLLGYCFANEISDQRKLLGLSLLLGIGGGGFIASLLLKHNLVETERNMDFFKQQLQMFVKHTPQTRRATKKTTEEPNPSQTLGEKPH